jgi:hypothetical protein
LFSILQHVLKVRSEGGTRLRLTTEVHTILKDFGYSASDLGEPPTRIAELIPSIIPATLGAQDAAGSGMGGVHVFPLPDGSIQPMLWRSPFTLRVQRRLISFDNPAGTITNRNLELAVSVAQHDVLTSNVDAREATIHNFSDNTPTVFWKRKGAVSKYGPNAQLVRLQALHQRKYRYVPTYEYLPGPANLMTDDCSRRWDLLDSQLLLNFNASSPQTQPWRLCPLAKMMHSVLISALLTNASDRALLSSVPMPWTSIGDAGNNYAWTTMWTHTSKRGKIQSQLSKSSENAIATVDLLPCTTPASLARWKTPSAQ